MKAKLNYASGLKLTIPAEGFAPRLFLEWISEYQKTVQSVSLKVRMGSTADDIPTFVIELPFAILENMTELRDFINLNLTE